MGRSLVHRLRKRLSSAISSAPRYVSAREVGHRLAHFPGDIPAAAIDQDFGASVDAVVHSSARFEVAPLGSLRSAELSHYAVKDASLDTSSGALERSGKVIQESIVGPMHPDRFRISWSRSVRRRTSHPESVLPLVGDQASGMNYYHWLIDVLPRASVLESVPPTQRVTLIAPEQRHSFVDQTIDRLVERYEIHDVKFVPRNKRLAFDSIFLSTYPLMDFRYLMPTVSIDWLRHLFDVDFADGRPSTRRLYIQRAPEVDRHVSNERDVISVLSSHGFEVIRPEMLSVAEQALLFSEASTIVSTHGAGLSNMAFSSDAEILELVAPGLVAPHYAYLALATGNRYSPLWGSNDGNRGVLVDVDQLETLVAGFEQ
jgi:hypothetical protein